MTSLWELRSPWLRSVEPQDRTRIACEDDKGGFKYIGPTHHSGNEPEIKKKVNNCSCGGLD